MSKKYVVCYTENLADNKEMYQWLEKFDEAGYDVQVYNCIITNNVQPYEILHKLDELMINKKDIIYFVTDIKDLLFLCFRIYQQIYSEFIYFGNSNNNSMDFDQVFLELNKYKIQEEELIKKTIYTNEHLEEESYSKYCKPLVSIDDIVVNKNNNTKIRQKLYYMNL